MSYFQNEGTNRWTQMKSITNIHCTVTKKGVYQCSLHEHSNKDLSCHLNYLWQLSPHMWHVSKPKYIINSTQGTSLTVSFFLRPNYNQATYLHIHCIKLFLTFFCSADNKLENCSDLLLPCLTLASLWDRHLGFLELLCLCSHIFDHRLSRKGETDQH